MKLLRIPATPEGRRQYLLGGTLVWAAVFLVGAAAFVAYTGGNAYGHEFAGFLAVAGFLGVVIGLVTLWNVRDR